MRHVDTGELKQTIGGEGFRCTWDGRTARDQALDVLDGTSTAETRIHGVGTLDGHSDAGEPRHRLFKLRPVSS